MGSNYAKTYVKKPVPVQAVQFIAGHPMPDFFIAACGAGTIWAKHPDGSKVGVGEPMSTADTWFIETKEGALTFAEGAWIVKAADGRIWPTDDTYFQENYEAVE